MTLRSGLAALALWRFNSLRPGRSPRAADSLLEEAAVPVRLDPDRGHRAGDGAGAPQPVERGAGAAVPAVRAAAVLDRAGVAAVPGHGQLRLPAALAHRLHP